MFLECHRRGGVLEVGKLAFYAITRSCGWGQTIRLEKLIWTDLIVSQGYRTFVELSIEMFENLVFLMKSRWWLFGYILILLEYEANYHCPIASGSFFPCWQLYAGG